MGCSPPGPMGCSPPGSSVREFPSENTRVGCIAVKHSFNMLLQRKGPQRPGCPGPGNGDHWGTPWPDGSPDGGRPWVRGDAVPAPGLESRLPGGRGSGRTVLDGRAQGPGGEHTLLRSPAPPGTLTQLSPAVATASHGLHPSSYHETPTLVQQPPRRDSSPQEPRRSSLAQGHRLEIKGGNCPQGYLCGQPSHPGHQPQIQPSPSGSGLRGLPTPGSGRQGPPLLHQPQLTRVRPSSPPKDGATQAP